jgi:hypothetical protein
MNKSTITAELLERKQARRRRLAKLSFEEKIEIVEQMRVLQLNRDLMKNKDEAGRMRAERSGER